MVSLLGPPFRTCQGVSSKTARARAPQNIVSRIKYSDSAKRQVFQVRLFHIECPLTSYQIGHTINQSQNPDNHLLAVSSINVDSDLAEAKVYQSYAALPSVTIPKGLASRKVNPLPSK